MSEVERGMKIENCLVGKAYEIHVKSGGPDCGSERIQKAIDCAQKLGADVVLEVGKYDLVVPLKLGDVNLSGGIYRTD